ncbi:hypothetical protein WME90_25680 [Sorangium sp. So ce375]|uniref:hypothetical protein n=1 Tax=Sorangium sp. So ce375 TaxID=3133306 RepID=UPI003F5AF70E
MKLRPSSAETLTRSPAAAAMRPPAASQAVAPGTLPRGTNPSGFNASRTPAARWSAPSGVAA